MKCPLLYVTYLRVDYAGNERDTNCLKEGCAWWYEGEDCCAMTAIAINLTAIFTMASAMYNKIPSGQSFVK